MLFVVRHGRAGFPTPGAWVGRLDPPLSDEGAKEMEALLPFAGTLEAGKVYTSPLRRAEESARILADGLGLPLERAEGLLEMDLGAFSGHTPEEIATLHPAAWEAYLHDTVGTVPPGGEAFTEMAERVIAFGMAVESEGEAILVTHTGPLLALACHALGIPFSTRVRLHPAPASVTKLALASRRLFFFGHAPRLRDPS